MENKPRVNKVLKIDSSFGFTYPENNLMHILGLVCNGLRYLYIDMLIIPKN
jgi:hypothetical protein